MWNYEKFAQQILPFCPQTVFALYTVGPSPPFTPGHTTKTAVLPTTCPAKRECTARPDCSLVRRGVQHTKLIRPNS